MIVDVCRNLINVVDNEFSLFITPFKLHSVEREDMMIKLTLDDREEFQELRSEIVKRMMNESKIYNFDIDYIDIIYLQNGDISMAFVFNNGNVAEIELEKQYINENAKNLVLLTEIMKFMENTSMKVYRLNVSNPSKLLVSDQNNKNFPKYMRPFKLEIICKVFAKITEKDSHINEIVPEYIKISSNESKNDKDVMKIYLNNPNLPTEFKDLVINYWNSCQSNKTGGIIKMKIRYQNDENIILTFHFDNGGKIEINYNDLYKDDKKTIKERDLFLFILLKLMNKEINEEITLYFE